MDNPKQVKSNKDNDLKVWSGLKNPFEKKKRDKTPIAETANEGLQEIQTKTESKDDGESNLEYFTE